MCIKFSALSTTVTPISIISLKTHKFIISNLWAINVNISRLEFFLISVCFNSTGKQEIICSSNTNDFMSSCSHAAVLGPLSFGKKRKFYIELCIFFSMSHNAFRTYNLLHDMLLPIDTNDTKHTPVKKWNKSSETKYYDLIFERILSYLSLL